MTPVEFDGMTKILGPPPGVSADDCGTLPVRTDGEYTTSCWRPSFGDRLRILFGGRIWLSVWWAGGSQPPVALNTRAVDAGIPRYLS